MGDVHMQAWLTRSMDSVQSGGTVKRQGRLENDYHYNSKQSAVPTARLQ